MKPITSIKTKLSLVITLISTIVLLLAFGAFIVNNYWVLERHQIRKLATIAKMIGDNTQASLIFNDVKAAEETLAALKAERNVKSAAIFKENGKLFATYPPAHIVGTLPAKKFKHAGPSIMQDGFLYYHQEIRMEGDLIGSLYLKSEMNEIRAILMRYINIGLVIILIAACVAFFLSSILQKIISQPILELTQLAKKISHEKNYSIRAHRRSHDELGILVDSFNEMLSEIQSRERALLQKTQEIAVSNLELEESRENYKTLSETIPQIVWSSRPDGEPDYANRRFFEYTGIPGEQGFDSACWVDVVHPEDRARREERWAESVRTGSVYETEYRLRRADGAYRWHLGRALPVRDHHGKIVRWFGTATDVHEAKKAEEALEEKVRQRTYELSRANELLQREMQERIRAEKEMLEISGKEQMRIGQDLHDGVSQILTGISYMVKTLEKKLGSRSPAEWQDLTEISDLVKRAITEIKGLSRSLHPVELEKNGFIAAIKELAANTEKFFHIRCTAECDESIALEESATAMHLYRIAQESIHNAVKHGKAKNVMMRAAITGGRMVLVIKDDGSGLPEASGDVSGMGLRNMRYRAQIIGAALDIERDPRGGTIVMCTLPLTALAAPVRDELPSLNPARPAGKEAPAGKTRIVIIDDHPIVRKGIAQLIDQERDLEVCGEADDAPTGLQLIHSAKPHAVVVDISLKDSNGIDLVRRLKKSHPGLPALIVSMHDETVYAEQALRAGAFGYVVKQEASENVVKAIRKMLRGERYVSGRFGPEILRRAARAPR